MADKIKQRRDTQANWEAVNPILDQGELGWITDRLTGKLGDGTHGFNELQSLHGVPEGWINVKDFGAVGDGVHDDTLAIQTAIDNSIPEKSTVYIPHGEYLTTGTIQINKPINFIMDGTIIYDGNNTCILLNALTHRYYKHMKFNLTKKVQSDWETDTSKAIEINERSWNNIIFHNLQNFRYGIYSDSPTSIITYCYFITDFNYNLEHLYHFEITNSDTAANFIDQNIFWNAYLGVSSTVNPTKDITYFYLDAHYNGGLNCNIIYNPHVEGTRCIGFDIRNRADRNFIIFPHNESTKYLLKSVDTTQNFIYYTTYATPNNFDISFTPNFNQLPTPLRVNFNMINYKKKFDLSSLKDLRSNSKIYPFLQGSYGSGTYTTNLSPANLSSIKFNSSLFTFVYDETALNVGIILKLNSSKLIKFEREGISMRLLFRFLDIDFLDVTDQVILDNVAGMDDFYSIAYGFQENANRTGIANFELWINPDSNIKYVFISPFGTDNTIYNTLNILTENEDSEIYYPDLILPSENILYGPTTSRPTTNYSGQLYFDTDLKKKIVWNGTTWANLDGSTL